MHRVAAIWLCFVISCFAAKQPLTVDSLLKAGPGRAGAPNIVWAPDGQRFVVSERGSMGLYEARSGKQREIVALSRLEASAVPVPEAAIFDWTNRRVGETAIQWFADGKRLLIAAAGDLFIVDVSKGSFTALTQTAEAERDAKLSPDNTRVSFRRGFDLYTIDVESKQTVRLTSNGSETLLNGQLDWVYPEELNLSTAHWWSPDSQSIAYLQFDVAHEPVYPQVSLLNTRGLLEPERYPKAGDPNAEVRLGVVPAKGGATEWMDLGDPRGSLIARVAWSPNSHEVMAERLNRVQNQLDLLLADTHTGVARAVVHEEDKFWINVLDGPIFLSADRFVWTSERSGFRHLYVYGTDGRLQKQLTSGDWEVTGIEGTDPKSGRIWFTSGEAGAMERPLYSIRADGSDKRRLTQASGNHTVSLSHVSGLFLDYASSLQTRPHSDVCDADGSSLRVFRAAVVDPDEPVLLPTEFITVKGADGTPLYARMIKPAGYQAGVKYPAVVMVYGGPGVQAIRDTWQGPSWDQVLAQKGFLIWQVDNRGSLGRGHAFESVTYRELGRTELADQKAGIDYLVAQGLVDPRRIGLNGWSYGGYMTLYTVTNAPGLIKAAIAGAPVTNWRNYDSIYTERYMGLPEENEAGYTASSPQTKAGSMAGTKLLMIHNIEDDNVHFQNLLQMANAFENADKQFYMLVYSEKSHGVTGVPRRHLLEETTAFFEENLK